MTKPKQPRARGQAILIPPGEKRPEADLSAIPDIEGETIRIAFRADRTTVDLVNEHLDRLAKLAPGMVVTVSDAVRSLIHKGAEAYRDDD